MSDTAIGLLFIGGWSVAIPALVNLFMLSRRLDLVTAQLNDAKAERESLRGKLTNVRKNSTAARDFGVGSPLESSIWHAATQPHGPSVIPVFRVGGSEEGGAK